MTFRSAQPNLLNNYLVWIGALADSKLFSWQFKTFITSFNLNSKEPPYFHNTFLTLLFYDLYNNNYLNTVFYSIHKTE